MLLRAFPNVISRRTCAYLVRAMSREYGNGRFSTSLVYSAGRNIREISVRDRSSWTLRISGVEKYWPFDKFLQMKFGQCRRLYIDSMPEMIVPTADIDEGYDVVRYEKGQFFKRHIDDGLEHPRRLSAILYLNDNYRGGEIDFPYQKQRIKPKAGTAVMFPSSFEYAHEARPIISGVKFIVTTWFH